MPKEFVDEYYNIHSDPIHFAWYFQKATISYGAEQYLKSENDIQEGSQFTHMFCEHDKVNSVHFTKTMQIVTTMERLLNIRFTGITRIKSNFTYIQPTRGKNTSHPLHTDTEDKNKYMSMIYYINESDGDTMFFDDKGKIIKRVEPKQNRCVVFPSEHSHAGQAPFKYDYRMVTNFVMRYNEN